MTSEGAVCDAPPTNSWKGAIFKVVAIMSMSLDGFVADLNDGVAEVFDTHLRYPVRKA